MKKDQIVTWKLPMIVKILLAFVIGGVFGVFVSVIEDRWQIPLKSSIHTWISPFGAAFIQMLKMIVVPVVGVTLVQGASRLPPSKLGRIGLKLLFLYFATSIFASMVGIAFAYLVSPGKENSGMWRNLATKYSAEPLPIPSGPSSRLTDFIHSMFDNPFHALSEANFLGIIVFSILFGFALSAVEETPECKENVALAKGVLGLKAVLDVVGRALNKMVNWIMGYAPYGVFFLTLVNFSMYGLPLIGSYLRIVVGIISGIFFVLFVVYPLFILLSGRGNIIHFFKSIKAPLITSFVTRSSAAALPVSLETAVESLKIDRKIASFALPLGASLNMDGVCIHLPMFAILAANIFDISLNGTALFSLMVSTVVAAVGTGAIPGGSLMLLFIVLRGLGLAEEQVSLVISLAMGINPILDMFETMNNVAGDLMCAYILEKNNV